MGLELDSIPGIITDLLRQKLGAAVRLRRWEVRNQLQDYLVLTAELSQPAMQVVIKLAGPQAPRYCPFERTAALYHRLAAETTLPVPEVLAADVTYQSWPWRVFITRFMAGTEWASLRDRLDSAQLEQVYQQIGAAAAQLHSVRFPTFGEIDSTGNSPTGPGYLPALAERARLLIVDERLRDFFLAALDRSSRLFAEMREACVCHEDLHAYNLLFRPAGGGWRLSAILDFDKAWAGHAESDLARLEFWDGMTGRGFWQAYQASRPVDPLYSERKLIHQLFWCLEFAQPTVRHIADTRRVCRQLGLPEPPAFSPLG